MVGDQPTGAIEGIVISAVSHEGLQVSVDGKPARLAVALDDGTIIAAGEDVAREGKRSRSTPTVAFSRARASCVSSVILWRHARDSLDGQPFRYGWEVFRSCLGRR
jgi:hypothetical protein